ncbi:MAG: L,D-transpeptidase family protein [Eubacteriales bacterium]|nr:L,D-transpeptidase family protein [Eubacteriales bacterium]
MYRHTKAGLAVLLSGAMLFGSASGAWASETVVLRGPGAEAEALASVPQESSGSPVLDASGSREADDLSRTTGPGAVTAPSTDAPAGAPGQSTDTAAPDSSAPAGTPQTEESAQQGGELTEEQAAQLEAEQAEAQQEAEESQANNPLTVPKRSPRLQTTALLLSTQNWSVPYVNDQTAESGGLGFSSLSTFLESIHGDVLYRTYSAANGWSDWVLNGQQTPGGSSWVPVEAIQYRFKGPVADQYDIYYCATLNDGTQTGWAKNGQTAGAMNQGLYMTGFRLAWYPKGSDTGLDTSNTVKAAHADGVQAVDGVLRYIHGGDGSNFTGWGWVENNQYYFVDSMPVTGWQYIDGYKYYFAEDGRLVTDVESLLPAGGPYMLKVNKEMNCLTVYAKDGANGFIIPVKSFLTSVGDDTPVGTFRTPEKYRWRLMIHDLYTQYATRLGPGMPILLHSIIYDKANPFTVWASTYNNLGIARSAGCIRLATIDAKWIYDNCAIGTTVQVYNSSDPGPFERPTIMYEIPFEQTWDPTDPNVTQDMINAETQRIIAKFNAQ